MRAASAFRPGTPKRRAVKKAALITAAYIVFGVLWIVITDVLTARHYRLGAAIYYANILKGIAFVVLTALLIFVLVYSGFKKVLIAGENREKSETALKERSSLRISADFAIYVPRRRWNARTKDSVFSV